MCQTWERLPRQERRVLLSLSWDIPQEDVCPDQSDLHQTPFYTSLSEDWGTNTPRALYTSSILYSAGTSSLWLGKTKYPIIDDYLWAFCDKLDSGKTGGRSVGNQEGFSGLTWTIMIRKWFIGSWLAAAAVVLYCRLFLFTAACVGRLWSVCV